MVDRTPSEQLATRSIDRLVAAGLVRAEQRERMIDKIASGAMKGSDWRLEIELSEDTNRA
ncbi:hypothetical protein C8J45_11612 [Sphingomonas sp. PP-CE-3G-477]|uniref:hypothetical protein n=1 Tax=Sphingomonas sp. PP-CE-3G-477 TaxID=2135660 RepID=UPI000D4B9B8D|nr:hypothetical protein [Sphingomonas sp. PP-CE-3G-477]PTQ59142.1 hypothetical protein C8J45_11612 [Sphingomonas sp. PP-CE-3G-477]RYF23075.1 MAG: hypothetical protein EOO77_02840 [Oxalobacteraceae bacterium]